MTNPDKSDKTDRILICTTAFIGGLTLGALGTMLWVAEFI